MLDEECNTVVNFPPLNLVLSRFEFKKSYGLPE